MFAAMPVAGLAAVLLSAVPIPSGTRPSQAELEAALRAYHVRLASHLTACRKGVGCLKPPKAIKVRNYDCQATGTDEKGGPILFCRVTYVHKGGSFAHVKSPDECVPLRSNEGAWEVALVDPRGSCPGARE